MRKYKVRLNVKLPLPLSCKTVMSEFLWLVVTELAAQTKKEKNKKQANEEKTFRKRLLRERVKFQEI